MDDKELATEFLNFINEMGMYHQFLAWEENRGFDKDQLEQDITKFEEDV